MDALPDCRMLQQMGITTLKAIHKAVDPPMSVSAGLRSVGLDLTPGGINFVDSAPGQSPQRSHAAASDQRGAVHCMVGHRSRYEIELRSPTRPYSF
mgnify:CR=1 FL=1